jgi:RNA-directed DNA polymerase
MGAGETQPGSQTAGVDGQTRKIVEQMGVDGVLSKLRQELKDGTYRPLPARERLIPKRSGAPRSYEWVIEGDVEDCFGSTHQGLLMEQVRRRVTDKRVLALIRQFLAAGIMREQGSLGATPSGMPQGSLCAAAHNPALLIWVESLAPSVEHRPLGTRPSLRERVDRAAVAQPARA